MFCLLSDFTGSVQLGQGCLFVRQKMVEFLTSVCYNTHTTQGSYIGYYSGFPSLGGGFDSRTLLQKRRDAFRHLFFRRRESNPFKCRCPVGTCCHQCKHWWLPILSFLVERNDNANRFPYLALRKKPLLLTKVSSVSCLNGFLLCGIISLTNLNLHNTNCTFIVA